MTYQLEVNQKLNYNKHMDIKTMTVEQLKALAFDQLVLLEQAQNNLKVINAEIQLRNQPELPKEEVKPENKEGK